MAGTPSLSPFPLTAHWVLSLIDPKAEHLPLKHSNLHPRPIYKADLSGASRLQENETLTVTSELSGNSCITFVGLSARVHAPPHCGNPGAPDVGMRVRGTGSLCHAPGWPGSPGHPQCLPQSPHPIARHGNLCPQLYSVSSLRARKRFIHLCISRTSPKAGAQHR